MRGHIEQRGVLLSFIAENVGNFHEDERIQSGSHAIAGLFLHLENILPIWQSLRLCFLVTLKNGKKYVLGCKNRGAIINEIQKQLQ